MRKLSSEKREELKRLAGRPDEEIDRSDIPEIRELPAGGPTTGMTAGVAGLAAHSTGVVIGRFYRPEGEVSDSGADR